MPEAITVPLVFDSPHSGRTYPADFGYGCPPETLYAAEDRYVDELFARAPVLGAPLLCALFPRTYIDTNRAVDDIDNSLLDGAWPVPIHPSPRSQAGMGLIRRILKPGYPVYNRLLTVEDVQARIARYYEPYHQELQRLTDEVHYCFGHVWHIDCHSMPTTAHAVRRGKSGPDFVLGDRDGTSCDQSFVRALRSFLEGLGYSVALNDPYRGVEIVRRHGHPSRDRHSLQIEMSRALFMDEQTGEKTEGFAPFKQDIDRLVDFCAAYVSALDMPMAAD